MFNFSENQSRVSEEDGANFFDFIGNTTSKKNADNIFNFGVNEEEEENQKNQGAPIMSENSQAGNSLFGFFNQDQPQGTETQNEGFCFDIPKEENNISIFGNFQNEQNEQNVPTNQKNSQEMNQINPMDQSAQKMSQQMAQMSQIPQMIEPPNQKEKEKEFLAQTTPIIPMPKQPAMPQQNMAQNLISLPQIQPGPAAPKKDKISLNNLSSLNNTLNSLLGNIKNINPNNAQKNNTNNPPKNNNKNNLDINKLFNKLENNNYQKTNTKKTEITFGPDEPSLINQNLTYFSKKEINHPSKESPKENPPNPNQNNIPNKTLNLLSSTLNAISKHSSMHASPNPQKLKKPFLNESNFSLKLEEQPDTIESQVKNLKENLMILKEPLDFNIENTNIAYKENTFNQIKQNIPIASQSVNQVQDMNSQIKEENNVDINNIVMKDTFQENDEENGENKEIADNNLNYFNNLSKEECENMFFNLLEGYIMVKKQYENCWNEIDKMIKYLYFISENFKNEFPKNLSIFLINYNNIIKKSNQILSIHDDQNDILIKDCDDIAKELEKTIKANKEIKN